MRQLDKQFSSWDLTPYNKGWGIFAFLLVSLLFAPQKMLWAGGDTGGQTGQLLTFGAGARSLGMGRAFFAVADDATSIYSNPAGMTQLERKEIYFMQASLVEQTNLTSLSYVQPTRKGWVWGFNMTQMASSGFEKVTAKQDGAGEYTEVTSAGSFQSSESAMMFGFGKKVLENLAVGLSVKQYTRQLDSSSDSTITADATALSRPSSEKRNYALAIGLQNIFAIQSGDTNDKLPLLMKIGNSYKGLKDRITLALDLTQNFTSSVTEWNLGAEYWVWRYIVLRAGVEGNPGLRQSGFGLGIKFKKMRLDIAQGLTDLGPASRMGVDWQFGKSVVARRDDLARKLIQEGIAAYQQGNFVLGLDRLNKSLDIDPTNDDVRQVSGRLSSVVSAIPSAVGDDSVAGIVRKAILDYLKGDIKSAINALRYAYLEKDPTNEKLLQLLNKLEREGREKVTERVDQRRKGFSYIDQKLYDALQAIYDARYDKAIILLQEVLDLDPKNIDAMKRLGSAFFLIEQKLQAKEIWMRALELDPTDTVIQQYIQQVE